MDKVLISRYSELYQSQNLKVDPFLIQKMGLMQKHTFLKIKDFFLYALPTSLGFTQGQIILAMSERERVLVEELKEKPHQLRLRFESPLIGREFGLFLKVQIKNISTNVGKGGFVLVDLNFLTVPDDFKEILIELFLLIERLQKEYEERREEGIFIPNTLFKQLGIENSTHIIIPEKGRFRCLFKSLSIGRAEIYISSALEPNLPDREQGFSIEAAWQGGNFLIPAMLDEDIKDTHQERVKLIRPSLKFSAALTDIILPMTDLIKSRRQEQNESDAQVGSGESDGESDATESDASETDG
jgi:hypothetical protein